MIPAALLVLALAPTDWVPIRWISSDPKSLDLLENSPVNCLIVEPSVATVEFKRAAKARNADVVALGGASQRGAARQAEIPFVEAVLRGNIKFDPAPEIIATEQGVWPGINTTEDEAKAMPSGAPWIDTNAGFLRFVRASTNAPVWLANRPPKATVIPVERYIQAIADAASVGGRWVLDFDDDFKKRLLARDPKALQDWKTIGTVLRFYESHRDWNAYGPAGKMAVVQDIESGGLLSGGVLDMIATKHTPVRAVPIKVLKPALLDGSKMAVNTDPEGLAADEKAVLQQFTRSGGTVLSAPPGWKMPAPRPDQITLDKTDVEKLDQIWKEVNSMTNRQNLGVRLFNVSSMLSNMAASPDGRQVVLHLVNYSNYPIEDITVHMLGKYTKAMLYTPENSVKPIELFEADEGSGAEIPKIVSVGAIVFERQ